MDQKTISSENSTFELTIGESNPVAIKGYRYEGIVGQPIVAVELTLQSGITDEAVTLRSSLSRDDMEKLQRIYSGQR